ncbi:hypothetical protein DFJ63DRAFT_137996 [Scheffersomyces coipomensis]|uniref:uncharacterized protein n=1 Tax=Scheffersomyces coipomensis TaxID=1788519 RepID=UPI00315C6648
MSNKELFAWGEDMNSVKGFVSQLQATLNQILAKTPTIDEFRELANQLRTSPTSAADDNLKILSERVRATMVSPQIKVAVRLKQLFDFDELPLLQMLTKISFKANSTTDRYVNHFIDYVPSRSNKELKETLRREEGGDRSYLEDERKIGLMPYPPTLPVIMNDSLLIRMQTDVSYRQPSDFIESEAGLKDYNQSHNGKLAIKGRSIMELYLFEILDETFPGLSGNEIEVFRYKLLSNQILTKLAFAYNLNENCKYNFSKQIDIEAKLEMFSRLFLAYVGGVSLDNYSPYYMKLWIKKLYLPIIQELKETLAIESRTDIVLAQLQMLFTEITNFTAFPTNLASLKFVQVESDPYVAQVLINDEPFSSGTSSISFEDAKLKAANEILNSEVHKTNISRILLGSDPNSISHQSNKENQRDDPFDNSHTIHPFTQQEKEEYYRTHSVSPPKHNSLMHHTQPLAPQNQLAPTSYRSTSPPQSIISPKFGALQPYGSNLTNSTIPYNLPYTQQDLSLKVDKDAKNTLYALLGRVKLQPMYEYGVIPNGCQATVFTDAHAKGMGRVILGSGVESNKKLAGQKAAMEALNNRSVLEALGLGSGLGGMQY